MSILIDECLLILLPIQVLRNALLLKDSGALFVGTSVAICAIDNRIDDATGIRGAVAKAQPIHLLALVVQRHRTYLVLRLIPLLAQLLNVLLSNAILLLDAAVLPAAVQQQT